MPVSRACIAVAGCLALASLVPAWPAGAADCAASAKLITWPDRDLGHGQADRSGGRHGGLHQLRLPGGPARRAALRPAYRRPSRGAGRHDRLRALRQRLPRRHAGTRLGHHLERRPGPLWAGGAGEAPQHRHPRGPAAARPRHAGQAGDHDPPAAHHDLGAALRRPLRVRALRLDAAQHALYPRPSRHGGLCRVPAARLPARHPLEPRRRRSDAADGGPAPARGRGGLWQLSLDRALRSAGHALGRLGAGRGGHLRRLRPISTPRRAISPGSVFST